VSVTETPKDGHGGKKPWTLGEMIAWVIIAILFILVIIDVVWYIQTRAWPWGH
jgi:hypothetical protein